MTKEEIVIEVYSNPTILAYCKTLSWYDWEELKSELIFQLMKMSENKLQEAKKYKFLDYLCFKIIKRIVFGSVNESGLFYNQMKIDFNEEITTNIVETTNTFDDEKLSIIWESVEGLHWYDKTLFKMYYSEGLTLKQIERKTGINQKSVHYSIKSTRKKIKIKLNTNGSN